MSAPYYVDGFVTLYLGDALTKSAHLDWDCGAA